MVDNTCAAHFMTYRCAAFAQSKALPAVEVSSLLDELVALVVVKNGRAERNSVQQLVAQEEGECCSYCRRRATDRHGAGRRDG